MVMIGIVWPRLRLPSAVALLLLIVGLLGPQRSGTPSSHLGPSLWDDTPACLRAETFDVVVPPNEPPVAQPLLRRARKVADNGGHEWFAHYQWLSDHKVLVVDVKEHTPASIQVIETRTKTRRTLADVNKRLSGVTEWSFMSCEASPDGQRLIEHDRSGTNIMRMDGSRFRHIEDWGRWVAVLWLGNSGRWLNDYGGYNGHFLDYPELTVCGLQQNGPIKKLANSPRNPLVSEKTVTYAATETAVYSLDTPGDSGDAGLTEMVTLLRRSVAPRRCRSRVCYVKLPEAAAVTDGVFSRDCRYVAFVATPRHSESRLWACRTDGAHLHEIGRINGESDERTPACFQWTPDNRRLSFVYRDALYVVPVD